MKLTTQYLQEEIVNKKLGITLLMLSSAEPSEITKAKQEVETLEREFESAKDTENQ